MKILDDLLIHGTVGDEYAKDNDIDAKRRKNGCRAADENRWRGAHIRRTRGKSQPRIGDIVNDYELIHECPAQNRIGRLGRDPRTEQ